MNAVGLTRTGTTDGDLDELGNGTGDGDRQTHLKSERCQRCRSTCEKNGGRGDARPRMLWWRSHQDRTKSKLTTICTAKGSALPRSQST